MIKTSELLNTVTNQVVIDIMKENGSDLYKTTVDGRTHQECYWFKTICHDGDSHKLCYFTQTKEFFCYTNCGKMNFFEFIKRVRNVKEGNFYKDVILYVAEKTGYKIRDSHKGFTTTKNARQDIDIMETITKNRKHNDAKITSYYDKKILDYFDRDTFYKGWIDEGISIETMQKFGIEWYECEKHIIIPHLDQKGNLVGIRRRSLKPEDAHNKYMPEILENVCYDHPLSLNLYGLYENQTAIKRNRRAVIVEGEKSVLLSRTFYGNNSCAVATCGFNVSDWQIKALYKLGVEEIYLGFDKDFDDRKVKEYKKDPIVYKKYLHYKERLDVLSRRIMAYGFKVYLLTDKKGLLGEKDSPYDKGQKVLEKLIKDKVEVKIHD